MGLLLQNFRLLPPAANLFVVTSITIRLSNFHHHPLTPITFFEKGRGKCVPLNGKSILQLRFKRVVEELVRP